MNMGFSRMLIADPQPVGDPAWFAAEAKRLAWNAEGIFDTREIHGTLDQALASFTLVVGTSSRPRPGAQVLTPEEAASVIAAHLAPQETGQVALLLGQEDSGLGHEEQVRCHRVASIAASPTYPSLNLSQAALLFLYEIRLALLQSSTGESTPGGSKGDAVVHPSASRLAHFYGRLEEALGAIQFFEGAGQAHMMRELKGLFNRALLDERELAILEGIVHRIHWTATRGR